MQASPKAPLEKFTVAFDDAKGDSFRLDEAAGRYFGCKQLVEIADIERLGPVVSSPGPRVSVGKWLAARTYELPRRDGFWGLCLEGGSWIDVVAVDGEITLFLDKRSQPMNGTVPYSALAHRMRNQLNAVQMNAELLGMLTEHDPDTQIGRAAERVLKNARLLRETLDTIQDDTTDFLDLVETLRDELFQCCGFRLISSDMRIPAPRSYCSTLLALLSQWLVFRGLAASDSVELSVVPDGETLLIETPGLDAWVAHTLTGMTSRLRGDDVTSLPTRAFLKHDLGCGFWRDGRAAGAEVGYSSLTP